MQKASDDLPNTTRFIGELADSLKNQDWRKSKDDLPNTTKAIEKLAVQLKDQTEKKQPEEKPGVLAPKWDKDHEEFFKMTMEWLIKYSRDETKKHATGEARREIDSIMKKVEGAGGDSEFLMPSKKT